LASVDLESVLQQVIPWLASILNTGHTRVVFDDQKVKTIEDVSLVLYDDAPNVRVGLSFCHQKPQVVRHKLPRLQKQWANSSKSGLLGKLIAIRSSLHPMTEFGKQRWDELTKSGVSTTELTTDQLVHCATYQRFLSYSLTGKLRLEDGADVSEPEFSAWAVKNLTEPVKALARDIWGAEVLSS